MLTKKRQEEIVKMVNTNKSVTVAFLVQEFKSSESTIRRDIVSLDQQGLLVKVFGGAISLPSDITTTEQSMEQKKDLNIEAKIQIAKYAASLIEANDLVFIDGGTSSGCMIDYLTEKTATYVTNGLLHAKKLVDLGFETILIGGTLKKSTEAVIGAEAILNIQKYNFTKGFFGTNGVKLDLGFTTPDINEASTKTAAINKTLKSYILADSSKFNQIAGVTFTPLGDIQIISNELVKGYNILKA